MNHKSKITWGVVAALSIVILVLTAFSVVSSASAASEARFGQPGGRGGQGAPQTGSGSAETWQGRGGVGQTGAGYAIIPLSDAEKVALNQAIKEEYGALNLYQSVIAQFGSVYPFDRIARAEQQHINALLRQAEKYNLPVAPQTTTISPSTYASLADACAAGAAAEIADAALYDTLKPLTQRADLLQVFNNLQSASLNSHLPAFEACK